MDIEEFNKIKELLKNSNVDFDEFLMHALEHELEDQPYRPIHAVLDEFKRKISGRICPDQKVCTILVQNGIISVPEFELWNRVSFSQNCIVGSNDKIIIVMESPHKDEFKKNTPKGPASGKTGKNIASNLKFILRDISLRKGIRLSTSYDLYLVNAIQFQCSLGFSTNYFRDLIFIGLWFDRGKECFESRLVNLHLQHKDIVINACTHGKHSEFGEMFGVQFRQNYLKTLFNNEIITYKDEYGLRWLVCKAILKLKHKNKLSFIYQQMNHPCNWDSDINYR